jgi:hypothetical protein
MVKRLVILCAVIVASVILLMWAQHQTPLDLPAPSGHYAVGRASFDWTDSSRIDPLAPQKGIKRELTVWIWYPASIGKSARTAEYMPPAWRTALLQHQGTVFSNLLSRDLSRVRCHSFENAEVAPDQASYPVVLMKPGIGALALDYTTLCEDLASHGYIVVASDSPYSTFVVVYQDGRVILRTPAGHPGPNTAGPVITTWTADNRFLLDRLTELNRHDPTGRFQGRLNLQEVGVCGHSFGGATAAEFCHEDLRCKAGIDVDGRLFGPVVQASPRCPFMFLMADHTGPLDAEERGVMGEIRGVYDRSPAGRVFATLRGSGHFNFSDTCLLLNGLVMRASRAAGPVGGEHGLRIAADTIRTFFDAHLKSVDPSSIDRLPAQYPELVLGFDGQAGKR